MLENNEAAFGADYKPSGAVVRVGVLNSIRSRFAAVIALVSSLRMSVLILASALFAGSSGDDSFMMGYNDSV